MTEITQLAQHALNILTPLLPTAKLLAEKARDGAAGETGKTLLHWLIDSFKGKPAEASLERAIAEPTNPFRQKALLNDIEEQLHSIRPFVKSLLAWSPPPNSNDPLPRPTPRQAATTPAPRSREATTLSTEAEWSSIQAQAGGYRDPTNGSGVKCAAAVRNGTGKSDVRSIRAARRQAEDCRVFPCECSASRAADAR